MKDRGDWFITYTGRKLWSLDPVPEDIHLQDIAVPLSRKVRFGGHTREAYHVAQHCVRVSHLCPPEYALCGLLHDAPEAYLEDIIGPIKRNLDDYKRLEDIWWEAIARRFNLPQKIPPEVKRADLVALAEERQLQHHNAMNEQWFLDKMGIEPESTEPIDPWDEHRCWSEFASRYSELAHPEAFNGLSLCNWLEAR